MTKKAFRCFILACGLALICASGTRAQTKTPERTVTVRRNVDVTVTNGVEPIGATIDFMTAPITFDSETVTGAPYSAEAVTEVVQTLADGNRIVRQSKAEISRDGLGRTRREQGLAMLGPLVNGPEQFRQVQITDPQTSSIILLDPESRTARKLPVPNVQFHTGSGVFHAAKRVVEGESAGVAFEMPLPAPPNAERRVIMFRSNGSEPQPAPAVEKLGKQFMDGVEAEGTRTTVTIPAGQIGNELPITIVSERWFSDELKVLVQSRQSDPRFGETTYRLTNLVRGEPSPTLFEVPSDFTVEK